MPYCPLSPPLVPPSRWDTWTSILMGVRGFPYQRLIKRTLSHHNLINTALQVKQYDQIIIHQTSTRQNQNDHFDRQVKLKYCNHHCRPIFSTRSYFDRHAKLKNCNLIAGQWQEGCHGEMIACSHRRAVQYYFW